MPGGRGAPRSRAPRRQQKPGRIVTIMGPSRTGTAGLGARPRPLGVIEPRSTACYCLSYTATLVSCFPAASVM
jgi:hypothetical protein